MPYPNGTHCSMNLTWAELACKDAARTPYPQEWRSTRAVALAEMFEAVRAELGDKPIRIGSAYRTPEHNRVVRGARLSQHVQGRALDLYPPTGTTVGELHAAALRVARRTGSSLRGLGRYASFVHIDTRPSDALITWSAQTQETASGED